MCSRTRRGAIAEARDSRPARAVARAGRNARRRIAAKSELAKCFNKVKVQTFLKLAGFSIELSTELIGSFVTLKLRLPGKCPCADNTPPRNLLDLACVSRCMV